MNVILANNWAYPFHHYGGIQKRIFHLAKNLMKEGVNVKVVTSLPSEENNRTAVFEGIPYTFLPPRINWERPYNLLSSLSLLIFALNLATYLRKQSFDILHSHLTVPYVYLRFPSRVPVVFQPFEEVYEFKALSEKREDITWPLKRWSIHLIKGHWDSYCMKYADAIASEGDFQTEIFTKLFGVNPDKIFELPVAIDISSLQGILAKGELSRRDIGLSVDDFVLISVNQFKSYKGIDYLVEAFRLVKQNVTSAKLILIGSGPTENDIKKRIVNLGLGTEIIHIPTVSEATLYEYYKLSDLYVSPTLDTGAVQSVLEAMACGLPIVSTGQKFWVKEGINGFIIPPKEPEAIAQAVLKIHASGKSKDFGEASRRIAQNYDYGVIAKKAIEKYRELICLRTGMQNT